jgi:hypothetical protein
MRFAVIVTHDREQDFQDCMRAIAPQVGAVITVSHDAPYVAKGPFSILYSEYPPNISRMWNLGLDKAASLAKNVDEHFVAVLNDDAIVPHDWFDRIEASMLDNGAAAGCVHRPYDGRLTGYAFILRGSAFLRCDEQFHWWYGDDDLERQAEQVGGVAFANGADVEHRYPNSTTTGVLAEIAAQDAIRYKEKWG